MRVIIPAAAMLIIFANFWAKINTEKRWQKKHRPLIQSAPISAKESHNREEREKRRSWIVERNRYRRDVVSWLFANFDYHPLCRKMSELAYTSCRLVPLELVKLDIGRWTWHWSLDLTAAPRDGLEFSASYCRKRISLFSSSRPSDVSPRRYK